MVTIGPDEGRGNIASLLDRVDKGQDVLITRRPEPTAKPADAATLNEALHRLDELRSSLPPWSAPSADLLRELRDERY